MTDTSLSYRSTRRRATPLAAALARVGEEAFDVLLTDLALPGCSGIDVARQARVLQPALQVIVASGYGAPESATLGFPFAVLPKPYSLDQLRDVVTTLPV